MRYSPGVTITRRGKAWRISVYAGKGTDGREIRLTETFHGTKTDAKIREGEMRKKARGRADGKPGTFDQLLDEWLDVARHEASTRSRTDSYLRRHVRPVLGPRPVVKMTTAELDRFYLDLERKELAPSTIQRIHGIIRAALELAVTWEWIDRNPAVKTRRPEVGEAQPDPPEVDEVKRILSIAREQDPALFVFLRIGAVTSSRKQEVCALRRADVLLDAGAIRRVAAIGEGKGGAYVKATKTRRRDQVSIGPATLAIIEEYLAARDAELTASGFGPLAPDAFLFSNDPRHEKPWRPDHVSKRFARLRASAGSTAEVREMRHFAITEALRQGFSVRTVGDRAAHSRPSTTLNRYSGAVTADDEAVAIAMDDLLA